MSKFDPHSLEAHRLKNAALMFSADRGCDQEKIVRYLYRRQEKSITYEQLRNAILGSIADETLYKRTLTLMVNMGFLTTTPSENDSFLYKLDTAFFDYIREAATEKPLLNISIQVKGNKTTLKELSEFFQHVPWLFSSYKELKEVFLGGTRLSRDEANEILKELDNQEVFKKTH